MIDDLSFEQGQIDVTIKNTPDEDAKAIAQRIFNLFMEMSRRDA